MHPEAGKFLELCGTRYFDNPVLFAKEVIGIELTEQQTKGLSLLAQGKHKLAIKSGHGTGKSCLEAVAILWFMCTRPLCKVMLTAPSARQLYDVLMSEVRTWYLKSILREFDIFRFTRDNIRINNVEYETMWFATCVSVANPENISGMHAEHILAVVDEGAGVNNEIFVRLEGVLTTEGSYIITCGNPSYTTGYFYDIFHKYQDDYDLLTFNCEESPNVEEVWIQAMKDKYGEDSNIYKVRVKGEFAPLNEEVVIRREEVIKAFDRDIEEDENFEYIHIGVDVASGESNDFSVVSVRRHNVELERKKVKMKLRMFREELCELIESYARGEDFVIVNIDTTGLGFQLGQDLDDYFQNYYNVEINKINFSYKAQRQKEYANIFTEMIFQFAERLPHISLLDIDESTLDEDLSGRRYGYDFLNRYQAEKKRDFVKRVGRSPDEGDAVLLAFYDMDGYRTVIEDYRDKEDWSY